MPSVQLASEKPGAKRASPPHHIVIDIDEDEEDDLQTGPDEGAAPQHGGERKHRSKSMSAAPAAAAHTGAYVTTITGTVAPVVAGAFVYDTATKAATTAEALPPANAAAGNKRPLERRGSVADARMQEWAATRYSQWMSGDSAEAEPGTRAAPPAPPPASLQEHAAAALAAIRAAQAAKGPTDEHGRAYDWPFWARLVEQIRRSPHSAATQALKPAVMEHIAGRRFAGVPTEARQLVWLHLSDNHAANNMLQEAPPDKTPVLHSMIHELVLADAGRTLPSDPQYAGKKAELQSLLESYAAYDRSVGYCSALSFVAGILAVRLAEPEALSMLIRLMYHYDLRRQYMCDMDGLRMRIYQFEKLLERAQPALAEHLAAIGCHAEAYAGQWLVSLFGYQNPFAFVFQFYDLFLLEGYAAAFKTALALVTENAPALLRCTSSAPALDLLRNRALDKHAGDYKRWIEIAAALPVTAEQLAATQRSFAAIAAQSHALAGSDELTRARTENLRLSTSLRRTAAQIDACLLEREALIRENVGLRLRATDLHEQNYRLASALYEERTERARDMAVAETETQHLAALFEHRIRELEKRPRAPL